MIIAERIFTAEYLPVNPAFSNATDWKGGGGDKTYLAAPKHPEIT